jgi:hypothetical protein
MKGHILSLVLFVLGIVIFLGAWLVLDVKFLTSLLLGLIFVLVSLIFYRRGK